MNSTRKILIAEDDLDDQMLMKSAFKDNRINCQLDFVSDGEELLNHLEKCEVLPDLLLLDLNMPKIDGSEVLKTIRKSEFYSHIPVMVISTSSAEDEVKKVYSLGAAAYLIKPSSYVELLKLVKHLTSFYFDAATLSPKQ